MRLAKDRTTMIIAHRMRTLKDVERRLYFESGQIAGDGAHVDLLESSFGYAQLESSEDHLPGDQRHPATLTSV